MNVVTGGRLRSHSLNFISVSPTEFDVGSPTEGSVGDVGGVFVRAFRSGSVVSRHITLVSGLISAMSDLNALASAMADVQWLRTGAEEREKEWFAATVVVLPEKCSTALLASTSSWESNGFALPSSSKDVIPKV